MALITVTFDIPSSLPCEHRPVILGDLADLHLNTHIFAGFVNPIRGKIVGITPAAEVPDPLTNDLVAGNTYNIQIDDADLPAGLTTLVLSHLTNIVCQSCCTALEIKVTEVTDGHGSRLDGLEAGQQVRDSRLDTVEASLSGFLSHPTTWIEVVQALDDGEDVRITSEIAVDSTETLSKGHLIFTDDGCLSMPATPEDKPRTFVVINIPITNHSNRQIFKGYEVIEKYPERWTGLGTNIFGSFGGDNERNPQWWGLTTSFNARKESETNAQRNSDAIAAAAMSARTQNLAGAQLNVVLPAGEISIHRTVRLDGLRCRLRGQGVNATKLIGEGIDFTFKTDHFILTEDYDDGSTPMIEIGYEEQQPDPNAANPDANPNIEQGFMGGVVELTVTCPAVQATRRISGVMWESALQEQTRVEWVTVEQFGGYAFGGPHHQVNSHNNPDRGTSYPQVNQVLFSNLWMYAPVFRDAIPMCIFGKSFRVQNVTIDHGRENIFGGVTVPAILTGSQQGASWSTIHIEQAHRDNETGIGIRNPFDPANADRLSFEEINYLTAAPAPTGSETKFRTLLLESAKGAYFCKSITQSAPPNLHGGGAAIEDTFTGKTSNGYHGTEANGTYVAMYSRQMTAGVAEVASSDPALLSNFVPDLRATKVENIPPLDHGESHTTTVDVPGAVLSDHALASMDIDTKGVILYAYVSAADTVSVRYQNNTGVPVDFFNATIHIIVKR